MRHEQGSNKSQFDCDHYECRFHMCLIHLLISSIISRRRIWPENPSSSAPKNSRILWYWGTSQTARAKWDIKKRTSKCHPHESQCCCRMHWTSLERIPTQERHRHRTTGRLQRTPKANKSDKKTRNDGIFEKTWSFSKGEGDSMKELMVPKNGNQRQSILATMRAREKLSLLLSTSITGERRSTHPRQSVFSLSCD
jgi:hypothetical protein